jgi:hypothetical protein
VFNNLQEEARTRKLGKVAFLRRMELVEQRQAAVEARVLNSTMTSTSGAPGGRAST